MRDAEPIFDGEQSGTRSRRPLLIGLVCACGVAVLGCAGVLAVVFIGPAVQQARIAAQRDLSSRHLKQIGLATHNYHDTYNTFPFAAGELGEGRNPLSFHAGILPQMEQGNLYQTIDHNKPWTDRVNKQVYTKVVEGYLSPEYEVKTTSDGFAATHFVPNSRFYSHQSRRQLRMRDIKDGTANTILAGGINAGFPAWGDPGNPRDPAAGFAGGPVAFGGNGGAMMLLADGSVRFISESASRDVAMMLATPDGGERIDRKTGDVIFADRGGRSAPSALDAAENQLASIKAQMTIMSRKVFDLESREKEWSKRINELSGKLRRAEQERDSLRTKELRSRSEIARQDKQIEGYKSEIAALQADRAKQADYYNREIARLAAEQAKIAQEMQSRKEPMNSTGASREVASKPNLTKPGSPSETAEVVDTSEKDVKMDLKILGLAFHNFHDTYGHAPPLAAGEASDKRKPTSWHTALLPYIDQGVLFQNIDQQRVWTDPANAKAYHMEVPRFLNPDHASKTTATGYAAAHYVPNRQLFNSRGGGLKMGQVTDGTSFTVLAGSVSSAIPAWGDPDNARDVAVGFGGGPIGFGENDQGAHVVMMDGSVRFVRKDTSPDVVKAIATPSGRELVGQNDF